MYQKLFNFLEQDFGVTATESDMQALIAVAGKLFIEDVWKVPAGSCPDGNLLIEVDRKSGDSDVAIVFIGEDEKTLFYADDVEDVCSSWEWSDVSRYCLLSDIMPSRKLS